MTILPGGKVQQTRVHGRWMGRHAAFRRVARGGRQQLSDDAWVSCTPNKQINIARLAGRSRNRSVWSRRWWHRIRPPRAISLEMRAADDEERDSMGWPVSGEGGGERSGLALLSFACRSISANAQHPKKTTPPYTRRLLRHRAINGAGKYKLRTIATQNRSDDPVLRSIYRFLPALHRSRSWLR